MEHSGKELWGETEGKQEIMGSQVHNGWKPWSSHL